MSKKTMDPRQRGWLDGFSDRPATDIEDYSYMEAYHRGAEKRDDVQIKERLKDGSGSM